MNELERSPEFERHLEEVRRMPQETEQENEEKREAAKLLRMEALLDNAQLAKLLTEKLEEDPTVTPENLTNAAFQSGKIIHPETVDRFIRNIVRARDRVRAATQDMEREAEKSGEDPAHQIYRWLTPPKFPGQKLRLEGEASIDTSYPLAIILYVREKKDFNKIDSRINVAGFYKDKLEYMTTPPDYKGYVWRLFPVAVVHGVNPAKYPTLDSPESERATVIGMHEKGHAENKALIDSVAQTKVVWGEYDKPARLENPYYPPPREALLEFALAHAKDELLSELNAKGVDFYEHLPSLMKKGGVYDYFSKQLSVPSQSQLYAHLWDDYRLIVGGATQDARELAEGLSLPTVYNA